MRSGIQCWARVPESDSQNEVYVRAIIINLDNKRENAFMTYPTDDKGPDSVPVSNLLEANQDYANFPEGWEDMVQMGILNEAEILNNVK